NFRRYILILVGYLLAMQALLPLASWAFQSFDLFGRATVAILLIAPAGLLMGQAFPTGMALVRADDTDPTPWLWGINGAAGVIASALAAATSIAFGIPVTLLIGAGCYGILSKIEGKRFKDT
ncbi:MAG: hypothetical protein H6684_16730, partial [Deltaproteobacteria bacterium]|nr:hypothetical protein [Deltaproteobacteria bacterium]